MSAAEPQPRSTRPRQYLGVAAVKQRNLGRFTYRERQQLQHSRASRHRLRDTLHQRCLLGAGEQPLAAAARLVVDPRANQRKHFRHVLHFVEDRRRFHCIKEALGIGWVAMLFAILKRKGAALIMMLPPLLTTRTVGPSLRVGAKS
jgi:hypothetical protein